MCVNAKSSINPNEIKIPRSEHERFVVTQLREGGSRVRELEVPSEWGSCWKMKIRHRTERTERTEEERGIAS